MRLAFLGTPEFAAVSLAALIASGVDIRAVYTRAPKPSGRGRRLTPSPVHRLALAHDIDVRTPSNFRGEETLNAFEALQLDAAIVVAYGLILPQAALDAPRLGCFNLHASLLPRWRGAAPIQRAIMSGDAVTGVQVMGMEAGLDTGPVFLSEVVAINDTDTAAHLHDRLALAGARLLPRFLDGLARGEVQGMPQSADGVCYADKIQASEARIDWRAPAQAIDRRIRGLSPVPGAWFEVDAGKGPERIKVLMSRITEDAPSDGAAAGTILCASGRLIVAAEAGAIELISVQRAGRARQDADEFLRGFPLVAGAWLPSPQ